MINDIYKKYIKQSKRFFLLVSSSIIFIVILVVAFTSNNKTSTIKDTKVLKDTQISIEPKVTTTMDIYYYVDIKGAVTNPGVYHLKEGSRIADAITYAGGLTKQADTSVINQSKKLTDEMIIIIYTKDEIKSYKSDSVKTTDEIIKYITTDCKCPDPIINDACITNDVKENTTLISLNMATIEELMALSGLGESKANAIISYRDENGKFTDINQVKDVSGIGDSIFDKIKNYITI